MLVAKRVHRYMPREKMRLLSHIYTIYAIISISVTSKVGQTPHTPFVRFQVWFEGYALSN
jgi:hypothetical protein